MKEKKFDYRKYISQNTFEIGKVESKNFANSKNVVDKNETKKEILK
jgi:hypothetical protein